MGTARNFPTCDQFTAVVGDAGPGRRVVRVGRLRGGTRKGVYRLWWDDQSTAIGYVWAPDENYWPDQLTSQAPAHPFATPTGLDRYLTAQRHLAAVGVRTPGIYLTDTSRSWFAGDVAVLEDVTGGNLETALQTDPRGAEMTMSSLGTALGAMWRESTPRIGKVGLTEEMADGVTCAEIVLERALVDLAEAAARDNRIGGVHDRLEEVLGESAAAVRPRVDHRLIHGELGADHVLIDHDGHPVLIDIEGLMYFDLEWEHVFVRLRFGDHYHWLRRTDLDPRRLEFYRLAMHLSLVAGPLRLLDGDFPDRDVMLGIVEFNRQQVLAYCG